VASFALVGISAHASAQERSPGEPPPREVRTVAELVVTSQVGGNLGRPVCTGGTTVEAAPFASLTTSLVERAQAPDRPLILDTGSLLNPGGLARFASEREPARIASLIAALGYRALVFGPSELSAPRSSQIRVIQELRARGIPTVASNLFCDEDAAALCDALVDGHDGVSMFSVGERRLGLVTALPQTVLTQVAPDLARGVRIAPQVEYLGRSVRRARAAGADLVVAVVHVDATKGALALASEIPDDRRPDIMVVANGGGDLVFARPRGFAPAIIAAPPESGVHARVRETPLSDSYDVLVRPLASRPRVAEPYEQFLAQTGVQYCEQWGRVLPGGRIEAGAGEPGEEEPLTGREMLDLASNVIRSTARADVAVLNEGVLDPRWRPARTDAITAGDVYMALQYDEPLVVADVPLAWLDKLRTADGLVTVGLEEEGMVNDRPTIDRATYRVVTLRFLAMGGDGALPDGPEWEPLDTRLREAVLAHLERPTDDDARRSHWDPADSLEWTLRGNLDASFAGAAVVNPVDAAGMPIYDETQLARTDTLTFGLDTNIRADGVSRQWAFENGFRARILTTRTGTGDYAEGADVLSLRSQLVYRGFRAATPRFYIPEPFVEGYLESELTVPDERSYRHMLLQPTAGLRFSLTEHLNVKLGGGFQVELLDPNRMVDPGFVAQLQLKPLTVLEDDGRTLTLAANLDYFLAGSTQQLRGQLETVLDLAGALSLVINLAIFGQQDEDQDLGLATDATIALRMSWLGRLL
jgi:hypothetical protein